MRKYEVKISGFIGTMRKCIYRENVYMYIEKMYICIYRKCEK